MRQATEDKTSHRFFIRRMGGVLMKVVPVVDKSGKIIQHLVTPLMVEFRLKDLMQVIVGASLLAIPVGFTEEAWVLAETLPTKNIFLLGGVSLLFIAIFVYFNFYKGLLKEHFWRYLQRVFSIYSISLLVVGGLLTIIQKCPWGIDNLLAVKRLIIVAFPASMSAAISDTLK